MRKSNTAFTLVELLVVLGILGTLSGLLFPVFGAATAKARQTQCAAQLRQIGMSWMLYAEAHDEAACPSYYFSADFQIETAWDFRLVAGETPQPGLLSTYGSAQIWKCPVYEGESWGRPFTGYGYNTTYVGGDISPAALSAISEPTETVLFADCGFGDPVAGANYLRAPSDSLGPFGTAHARHSGRVNVWFGDGRLSSQPLRRPANRFTGFLSQGDELYDL